ncbi:hypothetical protein C8Q80DRAFT_46870 [Daedaleopsis nitida]|nr:hypothetical protein C8Q80DRAFT_46870 [Daedaleopsis nitida]
MLEGASVHDSAGQPPVSSSHSIVLAELVTRPLEDIAREMTALRTAKESLARDVARMAALMPELELLRKESPVLRSAIKIFVRQTEFVPAMQYRAPPGLPLDIVRMVLKDAVAPPYEYDPRLWLGPRSAWMDNLRFCKNLTLVCRDWWEPATSLFYEHVTLRRMGQVSALLDTLTRSRLGPDLSSYVKSITLFDFVVLPSCADMVRADLHALQSICTTLRSFSFTEQENISFYLQKRYRSDLSDFDLSWMPAALSRGVLQERAVSTLRKLELSMYWDPEALINLHRFLASTTHLSSLKLEHVDRDSITPLPLDFDNAHSVSLCTLEELHMDGAFIDYATSMWSLAQLKALTIQQCPHAADFVCRHGQRLTYLHIYEGRSRSSIPQVKLPRILDQCPLLEHLVGPNLEDVADALLLAPSSSVHLQYLDVQSPREYYPRTRAWRWTRESLMKWVDENIETAEHEVYVPALVRRNIRLIQYNKSLVPLGYHDIPRILHPAALLGEDKDRVRFATLGGQPWVQTSWLVCPNIDFAAEHKLWGGRGKPEEDEDSSYAPEENEEDRTSWISDDSDRSSAGSEGDGGSEGAVLEELTEEEDAGNEDGQTGFQLDREIVLSAFRRSQDVDYLLD